MDMPVSRSISASHADSKPLASWAAVTSIGVGAFALVTTEFLPVGLLPLIAADLGISEGTAGLMVTVPGFLAAIAAPMTLGFAARFDRKRVLVALLMLLVISNAIVATAHGFAALMFGRVLLGIAVGGFWTIGGSLGPRLRPGAEGPRATALIFSGVSLGTVAGVPAGALIGDLFGWRTAFLLVSGVALLVVAALQFLLPAIRAQKGSGLKQVPDVLRLQRVQIGLTAAVLIFVGQFAAYTYITPFLIGATEIDTGTLSMVLLGYGAASLIPWQIGDFNNAGLSLGVALDLLSNDLTSFHRKNGVHFETLTGMRELLPEIRVFDKGEIRRAGVGHGLITFYHSPCHPRGRRWLHNTRCPPWHRSVP
ncbi:MULTISPECIES: MFS transporter [unclassified Rhizobium]|uniref:MFS transporter n=1 Tax=unclassified Rhizobium TaxID=2613769 RepID=UPI002479B982|nr:MULTISPECIES: MFS transporter [unclassified Rhizobium]MDH7803770.1 putative MFS family arabinose efflux permease [Rhizobium sp. AN70]